MGRTVRHRAQDGDAMGTKPRGGNDDGRPDQAEQGPGDLAVDAFRGHDDGEDSRPDRHRPSVGTVEMPDHGGHPVHRRPRHRRQGEQVGELVHDDDHRHAGQEAGDDGG